MRRILDSLGRLRLNTKLALGFGFIGLVALAIGLQSIYTVIRLSEAAQRSYEVDLLGIFHAEEAQVYLVSMGRNLRQMALSADTAARVKAGSALAEAEAQVQHEAAATRSRIVREEALRKLSQFDSAFASYSHNVAKAVALLAKGDAASDGEAAKFIGSPEFDAVRQTAEEALDAIVKIKQDDAQQAAQQGSEGSRAMLQSTVALLVLGLAGASALGLLIGASIRRPLEVLSQSIDDLAEGRLDIAVPHADYGNEIGAMASSVLVLQQGARSQEAQRWVKQGLAEIDQTVQTAETYREFADRLCVRLAEMLGLVYGALYVADEQNAGVRRIGGYGCDDALQPPRFAWGQGLVGQVAVDRRQISLALPGEQALGVGVGLGLLKVNQLLIAPVADRGELLAVLELGSLAPLDERQLGFVEALLRVVAQKLQILAGNVATRELLAKTQAQAQELAASEQQLKVRRDELEENNDKLAEQARALEEQAEAMRQAEESLRQANEEQLAIFESLTHGIGFIKDRVIVRANSQHAELFGRTMDELVGQSTSIWYADEEAYVRGGGAVYDDLKRGVTHQREQQLRRKDGSLFWCHVSARAVDAHDLSRGLVCVLEDISERKEAEEKLRLANFLSDQALDLTQAGYWHVPLDGSNLFNISERAAKVFGNIINADGRYDPTDEWAVNLIAADKEIADETFAHFAAVCEGREPIYDATYPYRRPIDGRVVWIHALGQVVKDATGKPTDMYGVSQDVTESKLAADAIREAKEIAEEATRAKSDFLANMSHEIRTPMNAIIGMSHLALQTDLSAKQRNYIAKVDSAAKNLLGIINDILDFSKIEAGKMKFESTDFYLEDVMDHLADLSVIKAQDKGLELLFDVGTDVPTALVGDPLRLGQVIVNLVNNAIKFTEKGEITVGVHQLAASAGGVTLRFEIRDTGIGLTEEQRGKLFSAFSQADASTTRKYGGTGLGLTISKKLVEMMEGEIGVDSQPGRGSTFHFTARFAVQGQQRRLAVSSEDARGLRILVVDDNASAREILQNILVSLKFDASAVASGAEAIGELEQAQLERKPYGLVLMDWMMPGMDGVETIKRIRADSKLAQTPAFVMVTAYSRDELLARAEGVQIDGVLVKPVSPSTLLDSILNALGKEVTQSTRKHEKQAGYKEAAQKVRGARLLLVEDNAVNQELALEILQEAGLAVDVASNGAEAVERVAQQEYDGVLMDCQMPVMDGFEATRRIRQSERNAGLPILAMTANAMAGDKEKCLASGMNAHITKPIDVAQLFLTLAQWITPRQAPAVAANAPGEAVADGLPAVAGLDLKGALARVGGSSRLLLKLISRFAETQADVISRIEAAMEANDVDTAVREAHTVKGLAGNIGAKPMAETAATVEALLQRGESAGLAAALAAMGAELSDLVARIAAALGSQQLVQSATASAAPTLDKAGLALELRRLASLLADDDADAGEAAQGLAGRLEALGQTAAVKTLCARLDEFDFDGATTCLGKIASDLDLAL